MGKKYVERVQHYYEVIITKSLGELAKLLNERRRPNVTVRVVYMEKVEEPYYGELRVKYRALIEWTCYIREEIRGES